MNDRQGNQNSGPDMSSPSLNISNSGLSFIGFGEAASAFAQGWGANGASAIRAYDIKTDSADPQIIADKKADYTASGITGAGSLAETLDGAKVVFSLVTADQAHDVARLAARHISPEALYMDCNSCAPGSKRKSAELIEAAGGRYVDVAVMAPVYPAMHKTPLLISGPHTEAALDLVERLDMVASEAPGDVGTASSIKMIRSIMVKGLEALMLEGVLSARKAGVEDVVLASLEETFPGFNWTERAGYMMERVTTHGIRRAAEMREVALTVDELGLDGDMSRATVDWQQRVGDLAIRPEDTNDKGYKERADRIIARLNDRDQ
jgi:3-hydroxyisobutyrate dehydrogenase-like beta-hydroxyacid dehydrogenase